VPHPRSLSHLLCTALLSSCLLACTSIGPRTVPPDRAGYGDALSQSSKEQLLTNMIRLRYVEAPAFVEISSIIDQYSREGTASGALGFGSSFTGQDTQSLGATGRWVDKPTITYTPMSGQKFARSMMTPLTPEALVALVQSGWSPASLLGMTVNSINGVRNDIATPAERHQADPEFWELLELWRRLRNARALALRLDQSEGKRRIMVLAREEDLAPEIATGLARFREILGLTTTGPYRMVHGLVPSEPNEIAILSRSTLEMMSHLSWFFEMPAEHVRDGRTLAGGTPSGGSHSPVIHLHHGCSRPQCAVVAVFNRGYWFWVEDGDVRSKRTFAILEIILSLADTGELARGPVVSIGS
jgi:hypothetical protein